MKLLNFIYVFIALPSLSSCAANNNINDQFVYNIDGFSLSNYQFLEKNIGQEICVSGMIIQDGLEIYIPLQPYEYKGVITIGISRINVESGKNKVSNNKILLENEHVYCGILLDDTPFNKCDSFQCKWYKLKI